MKYSILTIFLSLNFLVFADDFSNERGVVSSAGGRVMPELTCKTEENSRYRIEDLIIYDSSINNSNTVVTPLVLQFSLHPSSRRPSCIEANNYERFSSVIETKDGYMTFIDPRVRMRLSDLYILKFTEDLPNNFFKAELSGPLPCSNLLLDEKIHLICKSL